MRASTFRLPGIVIFLSVFFLSAAVFTCHAQVPDQPEFTANPKFFAAQTDAERCSAIKLWVSSAWFNLGRKEGGDLSYVTTDDFIRAAIPAFRSIHGRSYPELSRDELKKISGTVKKCSKDVNTRLVFSDWLIRSPERWLAETERFEKFSGKNYLEKLTEMRERKARESFAEPCAGENQNVTIENDRNKAYKIGPLIFENNLLKIYGGFKYQSDDCWYSEFGDVQVSVLFKTDENLRMDQRGFQKLVDEIVMPMLRKKVAKVTRLYISGHVDGYYLLSDGLFGPGEKLPSTGTVGLGSSPLWTYEFLNPDYKGEVAVKFWEQGSSIAEYRQAQKLNAERNAAVAEEKKRKAELQAQQRAEAKRQRTLKDGAAVLSLLAIPKGTAPASYDFSGYSKGIFLTRVYTGKFNSVTGDYEQADVLRAAAQLDYFGMRRIMLLRSVPMLAYVGYHQAFEDTCRSNTDIPWDSFPYTAPGVISRNWSGRELNRTRGSTYQFTVRRPYGKLFVDTFQLLNESEVAAEILIGIPDQLVDLRFDFVRFLKAEKCSSPALRQFEVNLYLITGWMLPLQELNLPDSHKE